MLNLFRFIASRLPFRPTRGVVRREAHHGPLVSMLECDLHNLDRLTRALVVHAGDANRESR